jgi:hypothetical protein
LLPASLMTVGLYGPTGGGFTPRYADPHFECINFLDSSGQRHVGEHNAVNLGAHVPHLGAGSGMELVADMFADGKNPLVDRVAKALDEIKGAEMPVSGGMAPGIDWARKLP